jgi:UDP-glucuronate 4-epimerase
MAYWSFCEKILKGESIDLYNHGDMKRDFTYIDDIIEGVYSSLFNEIENNYEIFNLGNNQTVTLIDFVNCLESSLGQKAKVKFLPMQAGDVYETFADINKARKILKYHPKTNLEQGIPKFVKWFIKYSKDLDL